MIPVKGYAGKKVVGVTGDDQTKADQAVPLADAEHKSLIAPESRMLSAYSRSAVTR